MGRNEKKSEKNVLKVVDGLFNKAVALGNSGSAPESREIFHLKRTALGSLNSYFKKIANDLGKISKVESELTTEKKSDNKNPSDSIIEYNAKAIEQILSIKKGLEKTLKDSGFEQYSDSKELVISYSNKEDYDEAIKLLECLKDIKIFNETEFSEFTGQYILYDKPSVMMSNKKTLKQSNDVTDTLSILRYYYVLHNAKFAKFKAKLIEIFFDAFIGFKTPVKSTVSGKFNEYDTITPRVKGILDKKGFKTR